MMYLRPGNLIKDFIIEKSNESFRTSGRIRSNYDGSGFDIIQGCITEADPEQKKQWMQLQHPVSHVIVQRGSPKAKEDDKLVLNNRVFFIQGIDNANGLGIITMYYVEERNDLR